MSREHYLFRGCLIPTRLPFLEKASIAVLDKLGIDHEPLPGATCCMEPIGLRSMAMDTWLAVTGRMLALAERDGRDILTLCNGCFVSLKEAAHILSDSEARERVNLILSDIGLEYGGGCQVRHLLEVIRDQGRSKVVDLTERTLNAKMAVHPGCHLVRPSQILGVERPFRPQLLAEVATWVGADVIQTQDWPRCCGGGLSGVEEELSKEILADTVQEFRGGGAELILIPCPFCFVQFDLKQREGLPVLYLAELLAWSFGASSEELGFKNHRTRLPF